MTTHRKRLTSAPLAAGSSPSSSTAAPFLSRDARIASSLETLIASAEEDAEEEEAGLEGAGVSTALRRLGAREGERCRVGGGRFVGERGGSCGTFGGG